MRQSGMVCTGRKWLQQAIKWCLADHSHQVLAIVLKKVLHTSQLSNDPFNDARLHVQGVLFCLNM
jgi:hypothetical protein